MDTCVQISNYDEEHDGEYKRFNATLFIKNTTNPKVLIYGYDDGWNGCDGDVLSVNPDCIPYQRWAWIYDLSSPIVGNVDIWGHKGDSSGYVRCGKF